MISFRPWAWNQDLGRLTHHHGHLRKQNEMQPFLTSQNHCCQGFAKSKCGSVQDISVKINWKKCTYYFDISGIQNCIMRVCARCGMSPVWQHEFSMIYPFPSCASVRATKKTLKYPPSPEPQLFTFRDNHGNPTFGEGEQKIRAEQLRLLKFQTGQWLLIAHACSSAICDSFSCADYTRELPT